MPLPAAHAPPLHRHNRTKATKKSGKMLRGATKWKKEEEGVIFICDFGMCCCGYYWCATCDFGQDFTGGAY